MIFFPFLSIVKEGEERIVCSYDVLIQTQTREKGNESALPRILFFSFLVSVFFVPPHSLPKQQHFSRIYRGKALWLRFCPIILQVQNPLTLGMLSMRVRKNKCASLGRCLIGASKC